MPAPAGKRNHRKAKLPEPLEVAAVTAGSAIAEINELRAAPEVKAEEIARLAYSYWEARGGDGGSADEDWLRAEQELRSRSA